MKNLMKLVVPALMLAWSGAALAADANVGKDIFMANCSKCHGVKGQGGIGLKLAGDAAYWDAAVFKGAVMDGKDDENRKLKAVMPRFSSVKLASGANPTDDDLANIQAFLKTLGPKKK